MNPALARVLSLLGLVSLGEGVFILARVVPHESPLLGAGLAVVGALLLAWSPPPRVGALPPRVLLVGGLLLAAGVLGHALAFGATLVPPKLALIAFGLGLAAAAPFLGRRLPNRARTPVSTPVAWAIPLVGFPLATWAAQAALEASFGGTTLLELFLRHALLPPMAAALAALGHAPVVDGQAITFATPRGPLRLHVGVACSGIQAMGLFAGLLMCYVAAERPSPRRAAAWVVLGLGGVYAANVARLVFLALVGIAWGGDALERAHAEAGWVFFVAWTGVFAWVTSRRPPPRPQPTWRRVPVQSAFFRPSRGDNGRNESTRGNGD